MKLFKQIISFFKGLAAFIYLSTASLYFKYFPNKEYKVRKLVSKLVSNLFIKDYKIKGKIDLNADMYLLNHTSMADIMAFENLVQKDLCWVAKKELGNVFLFGHLTKSTGMILIDREDKKSLIELLKQAKNELDKGRKIVIFPEGTRNKHPENGLLPFKMGAKIVAEKYNLKVQPILLKNIYELVNLKEMIINKNTLEVIALPTVKAQKKTDWYKEVEAEMNKAMKEEK